jgi:serine/threonine protein phosphatase PrpC
LPPLLRATRVADQGAWSVKGRRNAQEDAFVLTEISDAKKRSIVLSAVFDGHLGDAASSFLREELPNYAAEMLNSESGRGIAIERLMEEAWDACCEAYRASCSSSEDCTAVYDEREGVLMAYTGGKDAVAGSTGIVVSVDQQVGQVAIVNCGDSRALVIDKQGSIHFETVDHTPEREMDRLVQGREQGLDYNIPKCFGQWRVEVGDYDYAVARSLEGPFATAKGIVSKADVTLLPIQDCGTIVLASDGLWEVLDSTLIARFVANQRSAGWSASQITEKVTAKAYEYGSTDNISVVILFID